jgi:tetratricopeptide (TPR) repeat protein
MRKRMMVGDENGETRYNGVMDPKLTSEDFQKEFARLYASSMQEASAYADSVSKDKSLENPQTRQTALYSASLILFYSAHYDEIEANLKSFVFDYEKFPFRPLFIDCFNLLGVVEFSKKRFHLAIFYIQQALALAEEKKCVGRYSTLYSCLAAPYHEINQNEKCLEYLDESLRYLPQSEDGQGKTFICYNRSEALLSLGRYPEAKASLEEVKKLIPNAAVPAVFLSYLPLCEAEIALSLHEEAHLHERAMVFLNDPYQKNKDYYNYVLDDDLSLYDLLRKNNLKEDADLFLEKIEAIEKEAPSLRAAIFLAKSKAERALEKGDALEAGRQYAELCHLYEKQDEGYSADFEEITKLHFDFVRLSSAYQKSRRKPSASKKKAGPTLSRA